MTNRALNPVRAGNPGTSLLELPGWLRLAGAFAGNSPLFGGVTCAEAGQPARIEHKAATNSARGLSHPLSAEPASKAGPRQWRSVARRIMRGEVLPSARKGPLRAALNPSPYPAWCRIPDREAAGSTSTRALRGVQCDTLLALRRQGHAAGVNLCAC